MGRKGDPPVAQPRRHRSYKPGCGARLRRAHPPYTALGRTSVFFFGAVQSWPKLSLAGVNPLVSTPAAGPRRRTAAGQVTARPLSLPTRARGGDSFGDICAARVSAVPSGRASRVAVIDVRPASLPSQVPTTPAASVGGCTAFALLFEPSTFVPDLEWLHGHFIVARNRVVASLRRPVACISDSRSEKRYPARRSPMPGTRTTSGLSPATS